MRSRPIYGTLLATASQSGQQSYRMGQRRQIEGTSQSLGWMGSQNQCREPRCGDDCGLRSLTGPWLSAGVDVVPWTWPYSMYHDVCPVDMETCRTVPVGARTVREGPMTIWLCRYLLYRDAERSVAPRWGRWCGQGPMEAHGPTAPVERGEEYRPLSTERDGEYRERGPLFERRQEHHPPPAPPGGGGLQWEACQIGRTWGVSAPVCAPEGTHPPPFPHHPPPFPHIRAGAISG